MQQAITCSWTNIGLVFLRIHASVGQDELKLWDVITYKVAKSAMTL